MDPNQNAPAIATTDAPSQKPAGDSSTEKVISAISIVSTGIILIGALFPFYHFVFSPPNGSVALNGANLYSFNYTLSLLSPLPGTESSVNAMRATIFGLIIGNVLLDLPIVLSHNERLIGFLAHPFTQIFLGGFKSFAVAIQTVAGLGIIFLYTANPSLTSFLTKSPSEYNALQYYHPSLGFGFYVMTLGFIIALLIVIKNVGPIIAFWLFIITFILFITGGLNIITNLYEFLNRLDPLQIIGL